jgi:hypothetical protein
MLFLPRTEISEMSDFNEDVKRRTEYIRVHARARLSFHVHLLLSEDLAMLEGATVEARTVEVNP